MRQYLFTPADIQKRKQLKHGTGAILGLHEGLQSKVQVFPKTTTKRRLQRAFQPLPSKDRT